MKNEFPFYLDFRNTGFYNIFKKEELELKDIINCKTEENSEQSLCFNSIVNFVPLEDFLFLQ